MNDHARRTLALAATAFFLHAPGLRLLWGYRLEPAMFLLNVAAIAATVFVAAASLAWGGGWDEAVVVWLACHGAWSLYLSWQVLNFEALAIPGGEN